MKICAACNASKLETEFNRSARNRDGLHSYCRDCHKRHYRSNATRHGANVRRTSAARLNQTRKIIVQAMEDGCVDCGNTDIRVLEFDHVRGTKVDSVSRMVRRGRSVEVIQLEIAKCDVRCRNCHAIATLSRLQKSWHDVFTGS